jgi:hypothetical protein
MLNLAILTFKRYERKYVLTKEQGDLLMTLLREKMKPDKYCKDGGFYTIYNIYYDTANESIIRLSTAKPYYKEKMRLRTYSLTDEKAPYFLEIKKKINKVVSKRRISLSREEGEHFNSTGMLPEGTSGQIVNELQYYLDTHKIKPNIFLRYERYALFGIEDSSLRVTFDQNILARRDRLSFAEGDGGNFVLPPDKYLMEIKFENAMPLWLCKILSDMKIYSSSFSKYGKEYTSHCKENPKKILSPQ